LIGPKIIQDTTKKIAMSPQRMTEAQNWQKSYTDNRHRDLEFDVGEKVFLKVAPIKK
jgi:hypothetical protein